MYELPSLVKTAYYACNEVERHKFDLMEAPDVNLRECCKLLFEMLKCDTDLNADNGRQTMFSRLRYPKKYERIDVTETFFSEAAFNGHIECLKLAHEIGVPWNHQTCLFAAAAGNLDCLVYAHENGCPLDEKFFAVMVADNNGKMVVDSKAFFAYQFNEMRRNFLSSGYCFQPFNNNNTVADNIVKLPRYLLTRTHFVRRVRSGAV